MKSSMTKMLTLLMPVIGGMRFRPSRQKLVRREIVLEVSPMSACRLLGAMGSRAAGIDMSVHSSAIHTAVADIFWIDPWVMQLVRDNRVASRNKAVCSAFAVDLSFMKCPWRSS
jgi:hypothetical protein